MNGSYIQTWIYLTDITLNKRSQVQKRSYCVIPYCMIRKQAKFIEVRIMITLELGSDGEGNKDRASVFLVMFICLDAGYMGGVQFV